MHMLSLLCLSIIASFTGFTTGQTTASLPVGGTPTTSSPVSTDTSCATSTIVAVCLATYQNFPSDCNQQDYPCLCNAYNQILACYNSCEGAPQRSGAAQNRDQFCAAASAASSQSAATASTLAQNRTTSAPTMTSMGATPTTQTFSSAANTSTPTPGGGKSSASVVSIEGHKVLFAFAAVILATMVSVL